MAVVEAYDIIEPAKDWNLEFQKLKGELDDETATKTLGKFLMHNVGFTTYMLSGIRLEPMQRILMKGWFTHNFNLCVAGRGVSNHFALQLFLPYTRFSIPAITP